MANSITKRSRIAEYATYCGIALLLVSLGAWWEGHLWLGGLLFAAGWILVFCAILIGRPERRLRSAREE